MSEALSGIDGGSQRPATPARSASWRSLVGAGTLLMVTAYAMWAGMAALSSAGGIVLLVGGLASFFAGWVMVGAGLGRYLGRSARRGGLVAVAAYLVIGPPIVVALEIFLFGAKVEELISSIGEVLLVGLMWPFQIAWSFGAFGLGPR